MEYTKRMLSNSINFKIHENKLVLHDSQNKLTLITTKCIKLS